MFKKLLSKKTKKEPQALSSLDKLRENLEMLEKKEHVLQKKASAEMEKAKEFTKLKNKKAALHSLKKKKLYETQLEQLGNFQLRVHDQIIMLEGARATTDTIDALRTGASAVKKIQSSLKIDDIDKTMEEMNDHVESMKQIQEALSAPVGAAADFDEDELEAELEELEAGDLLELHQPTVTSIAEPDPDQKAPIRTRVASDNDVEELTSRHAEMAI